MIPEWVWASLFGAFLVVVGWGIRRLVWANDQTADALDKIGNQLALINGRLGKAETWQAMHERQDDERHKEAIRSNDALWEVINGLRQP